MPTYTTDTVEAQETLVAHPDDERSYLIDCQTLLDGYPADEAITISSVGEITAPSGLTITDAEVLTVETAYRRRENNVWTDETIATNKGVRLRIAPSVAPRDYLIPIPLTLSNTDQVTIVCPLSVRSGG